MNKSEDDELVKEARRTLLQHFSSKSTLQATILLSLAVAFFAFIQTIPLVEKWNEWFRNFFYSLTLTLFIFLTIRAFGRLIYWGAMAGLVERIQITSEEELKRILVKEKITEDDPTSCLYRVEYKCNSFLRQFKVHRMFRRLINECWGSIVCLLILFWSFFVYFLISNVIVIVTMVCILAFLAFIAYSKGIKKEDKKGT